MTPSETRNPAARSKSCPGVRIVTTSERPPTRISSGSSTANTSSCATQGSPTFKRTTFRRTVIPVSYTHLRAHETGRNLVCRLLLEKKKKTRIKEKNED